jgi:hypothetical protein
MARLGVLVCLLLLSPATLAGAQTVCADLELADKPKLGVVIQDSIVTNTERILAHWPADFADARPAMDSFETVLADSLHHRLNGQLTAALLTVMTQPDSDRESPLDVAAAHFYSRLRLSPDSLERILFTDSYFFRTRYLAFATLAELDQTRSSLPLGRRRLICQLVQKLRDDHELPRQDALVLLRLLINVNADSTAGNVAAIWLLGDESVKASWEWLRNRWSMPN